MDRYADDLVQAVEQLLPGWVERSVVRLLPDADPARVADASHRAVTEVVPRLRTLLAADIDDQRSTPLTLLREAARYPTDVLREADVPPVRRDEFVEQRFPEDVYDLAPATFADIDPELQEIGLRWGAAKAKAHLERHAG